MSRHTHPGFKAVQSKIASRAGFKPRRRGQSKEEAAGAILASASRRASPAAKRRNPRLKRVRGAGRSASPFVYGSTPKYSAHGALGILSR